MDSAPATSIEVRELSREHLDAVMRIDTLHTGERKPRYWRRVFDEFLAADAEGRVGLVAEIDTGVIGYLLGEVRAFEFGSEACGWLFSVGVDPAQARSGVASALLEHACERFRRLGVTRVRTMVGRNDVAVLSFFRANRFTGGSFVQMERELEGES